MKSFKAIDPCYYINPNETDNLYVISLCIYIIFFFQYSWCFSDLRELLPAKILDLVSRKSLCLKNANIWRYFSFEKVLIRKSFSTLKQTFQFLKTQSYWGYSNYCYIFVNFIIQWANTCSKPTLKTLQQTLYSLLRILTLNRYSRGVFRILSNI